MRNPSFLLEILLRFCGYRPIWRIDYIYEQDGALTPRPFRFTEDGMAVYYKGRIVHVFKADLDPYSFDIGIFHKHHIPKDECLLAFRSWHYQPYVDMIHKATRFDY